MHLLCNAYWLDTDALQGCDLPKIKETTYGFNQNTDVVATLPPSPLDNFCASAKHNSSPNTYSIDSAALISTGSGCSGAGGSVKATAEMTAENKEINELVEGRGTCNLINVRSSRTGQVTECCIWNNSVICSFIEDCLALFVARDINRSLGLECRSK